MIAMDTQTRKRFAIHHCGSRRSLRIERCGFPDAGGEWWEWAATIDDDGEDGREIAYREFSDEQPGEVAEWAGERGFRLTAEEEDLLDCVMWNSIILDDFTVGESIAYHRAHSAS